ncbi:hypothetical protein GWK47_051436 [Chionoecetes opilio]|uniref:Uncharacterized protein n=1 Tax=Chionoecetes opilio TaxID=41210 RepID=A0A8J4Y220_CHIOP|nr:hypothetical protein GWK47_051436 [Chionoecetes opilio]
MVRPSHITKSPTPFLAVAPVMEPFSGSCSRTGVGRQCRKPSQLEALFTPPPKDLLCGWRPRDGASMMLSRTTRPHDYQSPGYCFPCPAAVVASVSRRSRQLCCPGRVETCALCSLTSHSGREEQVPSNGEALVPFAICRVLKKAASYLLGCKDLDARHRSTKPLQGFSEQGTQGHTNPRSSSPKRRKTSMSLFRINT